MSIQLHNISTLETKKKRFNCTGFSINAAGQPSFNDIPCFANEGTTIAYNENTIFNIENNIITTKYNNQKYCIANNSKLKMSIYEDDCITLDKFDDKTKYLITKK